MVSQILEHLIKNDESLLKKDGSINQAAAAKAFGIHQPTLFRILSGKSVEPKSNAVQGICNYFDIQPAQLRGETPLEANGVLTVSLAQKKSPQLTTSKELLLSLYRALPPVAQKTAVRVLAALRG